MKRDFDLIRSILLEVESSPAGKSKRFEFNESNGPVREHVHLLIECGYLRETGVTRSAERVKVTMTWAGHDFLDSVRDSSVWEKTKAVVAQQGGSLGIELVKTIAMAFGRKQIEKLTGLTL